MKLVVSRKNSSVIPTGEAHIANVLTGIGNSYKALPDSEVEAYINQQVLRGFVCFTFDYSGTFHAQTTVVKAA